MNQPLISLLRAARERAGLTQVELARRARITPAAVSYLERHRRGKKTSLYAARQLSNALGIPLDELFPDPDK